MKSIKILASLFAVLAFVVLLGCGGGSSDGVGILTNNQNGLVPSKEDSKNFTANEDCNIKTLSTEITIPANSIKSDYNLTINKIDTTNLDSAALSSLRKRMGFDDNTQFLSPIINYVITLNNNPLTIFRASLNVDSDGFALDNIAEISINSYKPITDWNNTYYYLAFCAEDDGKWYFTPLTKEHFENNFGHLTFNINKIAKYYVLMSLPFELKIEDLVPELPEFEDKNLVTGLNIYANPETLLTAKSGKFEDNLEICVRLDYKGSNPFEYSTPTIEFRSISPFDLGSSVKSTYQNNNYIYNYKSFISPQSEINGVATFSLTLPTKNIKYDSNKHPANLFVTAKFKSKSNKDFESLPAKISFINSKSKPEIASPTVITSLNITLNETQILIATDSNEFNEDLVIDGNIVYEGSEPFNYATPICLEFISANAFDLGNNISGVSDGNIYSCLYEVSSSSVTIYNERKSANFKVVIPLAHTLYVKEKHPENIFIKAKINNKESNQVALRINKLQDPISENPPSNLLVNTTFPNGSNYLNASGSVGLSLSWKGDGMPFTAKFKYNSKVISSIASITENSLVASIPTSLVWDSNGNKYIEVEIIDSANRSTSALSKTFIVDEEPPVLVASITNGTVFSLVDKLEILITSNKAITNPEVSCEDVNAVFVGASASNTRFIYTLQLNRNYTNGGHQINIVASDTTEPAEYANSNSIIATFTIDANITILFENGSGTASDPFLIATAEDLNNIRFYPSYCYKQVADIDLAGFIASRTDTLLYPSETDTNSTVGWLPIASFTGIYDGNNHYITNLFISRPEENRLGLFSYANVIKNTRVITSNSGIVGYGNIGILAEVANRISNCYTKGYIKAESGSAGGICSFADYIECCCSEVTIDGVSGGGIAYDSNVSNCFSNATIINGFMLGGGIIVGDSLSNSNTVSNCYSTGYIDIFAISGGITSQNNSGNTYSNIALQKYILSSSGRVTGNLGSNVDTSTIHDNYAWDGLDNDGDNTNEIEWSNGVKKDGLSSSKAEFWGASTQQSFWVNKLGWDFENVWEFRDGYNLPQLKGLPSIPDPEYLVNAD